MALFGKKAKDNGHTIAILDVENGSVAAALARLTPNDPPKLFAETRIRMPILNSLDTRLMTREIEKATREALGHISRVAARIRLHDGLSSNGEVERSAAFFSPPWAAMHLEGGTADYAPHMSELVQNLLQETFGDKRSTLHPFGTAAAHSAVLLYPHLGSTMLCIVSGEVTELLVIENNRVVGRATVPVGFYSLLRTLTMHAGISAAEARSLLSLASGEHTTFIEPLVAAQSHFANAFAEAAAELLERSRVENVLVIAPHPVEEWFARALAEDSALIELFPPNSTVRAIRAQHAMPYIAAHALKPDLPLMLEALFVDAKFSGIK
ncbi:MAG TPA: hypothetical protein VHD31_02645 [Candidatus Paceibacterota bacterium]|nr:hypothetical protein [Candidatus Paceibacterota bacterium]